eukprot:1201257-Rhodomonas_salina.3
MHEKCTKNAPTCRKKQDKTSLPFLNGRAIQRCCMQRTRRASARSTCRLRFHLDRLLQHLDLTPDPALLTTQHRTSTSSVDAIFANTDLACSGLCYRGFSWH